MSWAKLVMDDGTVLNLDQGTLGTWAFKCTKCGTWQGNRMTEAELHRRLILYAYGLLPDELHPGYQEQERDEYDSGDREDDFADEKMEQDRDEDEKMEQDRDEHMGW
jgi:hypothetical protein